MKTFINFVFWGLFVLVVLQHFWIDKLDNKIERIEERLEKLEKEKP